MPQTASTNEYKQKSKEELDGLQQDWQSRVEEAPIPIGRGAWITTKAAAAGLVATVPAGIAGFVVKSRSLGKETAQAQAGFFESLFKIAKSSAKAVIDSEQLHPQPTAELQQHTADLERAAETIISNAKKASTAGKYAALGGGLVVAGLSAFGMVKRRRKIISEKADHEVLKIENAQQAKALEDVSEKAKHTSDNLAKFEKAEHAAPKPAHGDHEKTEHEKPAHEKTAHDDKEKEHDGKISKEENDLLNERLAAGKHGDAKEHTKEYEKKDVKSHAEREEHGASHHSR